MSKNKIVQLEPVSVGFVLGVPGLSNAEQVKGGITFLEGRVPPGKPRKFFGAVVGDEYRICISLVKADDNVQLARWKLPGGFYRTTGGGNWRSPTNRIGNVVAALAGRRDFDRTRPVIEHLSLSGAVTIFAPVKGFGPNPREPEPPPGRPARATLRRKP